jgi:hypothetical protein
MNTTFTLLRILLGNSPLSVGEEVKKWLKLPLGLRVLPENVVLRAYI